MLDYQAAILFTCTLVLDILTTFFSKFAKFLLHKLSAELHHDFIDFQEVLKWQVFSFKDGFAQFVSFSFKLCHLLRARSCRFNGILNSLIVIFNNLVLEVFDFLFIQYFKVLDMLCKVFNRHTKLEQQTIGHLVSFHSCDVFQLGWLRCLSYHRHFAGQFKLELEFFLENLHSSFFVKSNWLVVRCYLFDLFYCFCDFLDFFFILLEVLNSLCNSFVTNVQMFAS